MQSVVRGCCAGQGARVRSAAAICPPRRPQWRVRTPPTCQAGKGFSSKTSPKKDDAPRKEQASGAREDKPAVDPETERNLQAAKVVIDDILKEVCQTMFVSEAVADVTGDAPETTLQEAVREAVDKRFHELDEAFLAALNAFIAAMDPEKEKDVVDILVVLRSEVLNRVTKSLPAALQILEKLLTEPSQEARRKLLVAAGHKERGGGGGDADVLASNMPSIAASASQFIEDMEEREEIPQRQLLAQLCIAREDVIAVDMQLSAESGSQALSVVRRRQVPQREMTFITRLLASDELTRKTSLYRAFSEDWEEAAPRETDDADARLRELEEKLRRKKRGEAEKLPPDVVRPGRFMATLRSVQEEIRTKVAEEGGEEVEAAMGRVETLLEEAMWALQELAWPTQATVEDLAGEAGA
ncbi:unnamed protein product [Pedinophyceae sp. YPF-701]|nr:unnamed protein product [Pedinophyceae sp. YPF-701]